MSDEIRDSIFMVSKQLKAGESHDLAYLYGLPASFQEESCRHMLVLAQMEAQQIIRNPETLAEAMERIDRKDLADKIRKQAKQHRKRQKQKKSNDRQEEGQILQQQEEFVSARIDVAKRQIEIAMESIELIPKSDWDNCLYDALDYCKVVCEALSESSRKAAAGSRIDDSTSDEENSSLSSIASGGETVASRGSEKQKPQPLPKPKRPKQESRHMYKQRPAQMCHSRVATPLAQVLAAGKDNSGTLGNSGTLSKVNDDDDLTCSASGNGTGDSGFCDASQFSRKPLTGHEPPSSPLPIAPKSGQYMALIRGDNHEVTNEYTPATHSTQLINRLQHMAVCEEGQREQEDDDHYEQVKFTV